MSAQAGLALAVTSRRYGSVVARLPSAEPRLDLTTSGQWRYQAHFTKRRLTAVMTLSFFEILIKAVFSLRCH